MTKEWKRFTAREFLILLAVIIVVGWKYVEYDILSSRVNQKELSLNRSIETYEVQMGYVESNWKSTKIDNELNRLAEMKRQMEWDSRSEIAQMEDKKENALTVIFVIIGVVYLLRPIGYGIVWAIGVLKQ